MNSISGAFPSASMISNAAVFCPSMRYGLTELTRATGCCSLMTRARRRGSGNGLRAGLKRLGDGDDHATVLERARGIAHLELEVQLTAAGALVQAPRANERSIPFAERDHRGVGADGQAGAIAAQDPGVLGRLSLRPVAHSDSTP